MKIVIVDFGSEKEALRYFGISKLDVFKARIRAWFWWRRLDDKERFRKFMEGEV